MKRSKTVIVTCGTELVEFDLVVDTSNTKANGEHSRLVYIGGMEIGIVYMCDDRSAPWMCDRSGEKFESRDGAIRKLYNETSNKKRKWNR